MLDRKGQRFDLQEIGLAYQTVDVNAQGMSRQFGIQSCAEPPEGMGTIGFDVELLG